MVLFVLRQNKNEKMPDANGLFYAFPVTTETYDIDQLAEHMAAHNTPFSAGAIKGMLTDTVTCIRELVLQGIAVKIDNLAIFSLGIKNKTGARSEEEFSVTKNIEGVKLRARATGDLMSASLKLDATLKKATALAGSASGTDAEGGTTPSGGGGSNPSGGGSTSPGEGGSSTGDSGNVGL